MNIISNSLFQFTKELDVIKSILRDGFKLFYCSEDIYLSKEQQRRIGIPMSCFCDIPLAHIGTNKYGDHSIGMNKTWGWHVVNMQPVFYYPNNARCTSTKAVIKASKAFLDNKDKTEYVLLGTAKPYHKISDNVCNYTDREWRVFNPDNWIRDDDPQFDNLCNPPMKNMKRSIGNALTFDAKHVDFIIVPSKERDKIISYIWEELHQCCGQDLSEYDKLLLISKVISREQLINNI